METRPDAKPQLHLEKLDPDDPLSMISRLYRALAGKEPGTKELAAAKARIAASKKTAYRARDV
jgi:hypothetical protein